MQIRTRRNFLAALALAAFVPFAAAVFQPGMSVEAIEAEVKAQVASGATLLQIAQRALAAGLNPALVTAALITVSGDAAGSVTAMLNAGADLQIVVNAALGAGASVAAVTQGALAAGVTLANIQLAIANSDPTAGATGSISDPTAAAAAAAGPTGSVSDSATSTTSTSTPTGSAGAPDGGGGGTAGGGTASPS